MAPTPDPLAQAVERLEEAPPISTAEEIEARIEYDPNGGCWFWTGHLTPRGYGRFWHGAITRRVQAHRASFECFVGPIPDGLVIDHLCRVRSCVNPAHLEPVTNRENVLRGLTIPAANLAKTHCIHGHPFTKENTRVNPKGFRDCLTCHRRRCTASRRRLSQLSAHSAQEAGER